MMQGEYPMPIKIPVVPGSDGVGIVQAVGSNVSEFARGDSVVTLFSQKHIAGPTTTETIHSGLGGALDGTLRNYAIFPQYGLVKSPANLSVHEASTLSCAPVTAWNSLYGLESKALKAGDYVLTQGTGGVSISAMQFARASGAIVIALSSSQEKLDFLKKHGANHVVNYKSDKNWGETVKNLTPEQRGVDHIVEVGGLSNLKQSFQAIKPEGVISIVGYIGGPEGTDAPTLVDTLKVPCIVRGIQIGSRAQFQAMNRSIEANDIHPVLDKVFPFEQLKEAYQYQWDQKHVGKVVVEVSK